MATPTKYAYVPSGYSGVLQYLPLWISKSPELYTKSCAKNPALKEGGLSSMLEIEALYPVSNICISESEFKGSVYPHGP